MQYSTGLGYLVGPIVGGTFWRMTHRANLPLIEARDREFYNHIVKNRANPAAQSATNPVPDYYGMILAYSNYVVSKYCYR